MLLRFPIEIECAHFYSRIYLQKRQKQTNAHTVPSWIISTLKMKVVRRYLPAGLINPSLSYPPDNPIHHQPPARCCRTVARSLLTPSEAPSTRRPREAHNFGFIAISLDPFHWRSVNNPVKRRACFPIGRRSRFRYPMDRATPADSLSLEFHRRVWRVGDRLFL